MSTTHRSDVALLPGYHHSGDRGQGVLASTIPATGTHGPALPYPGLSLPADADKEVMVSILSVPPALTYFAIDERGVIEAEGPDGIHTGTYRLWVAGLDAGSSTYTITFGPLAGVSGTVVFDPIVATGALASNLATLAGTATLAELQASGRLRGFAFYSDARCTVEHDPDPTRIGGTLVKARP